MFISISSFMFVNLLIAFRARILRRTSKLIVKSIFARRVAYIHVLMNRGTCLKRTPLRNDAIFRLGAIQYSLQQVNQHETLHDEWCFHVYICKRDVRSSCLNYYDKRYETWSSCSLASQVTTEGYAIIPYSESMGSRKPWTWILTSLIVAIRLICVTTDKDDYGISPYIVSRFYYIPFYYFSVVCKIYDQKTILA